MYEFTEFVPTLMQKLARNGITTELRVKGPERDNPVLVGWIDPDHGRAWLLDMEERPYAQWELDEYLANCLGFFGKAPV